MSWVKRRGQTTPSPATVPPTPPVQMYNPNQHSNQETHWQQPDSNAWHPHNQQKHNYSVNQPPPQQVPPTNYWQPYNQPTEMYNRNTNQYEQYNQAHANYYQNTGYQQQQNYLQYNQPNNSYNQSQQMHQKTETDAWNWSWGDEDNSNLQSMPTHGTNVNTTQVSNTIAESFSNDETWNWSVEESNSTLSYKNQELQSNVDEHKVAKVIETQNTNLESFEENNPNQDLNQHMHNINLDQLPSVITGKRGKTDNLTPQWSIESQISQESSDDILHTSESDKSHMLSRSSTISQSPISGHDGNSDLSAQANLHESSSQYNLQQLPVKQEQALHYDHYEHDNAVRFPSNVLQHENKEILSNIKQDNRMTKTNGTPPPPMKNQSPPILPLDEGKNPYKRNSALTHKASNRYRTDNKQQSYLDFSTNFNQTVNLETLPDNSEQPDSLPQPVHKISSNKNAVSQRPDNNEVAPINDRNQYLETGQLSDADVRDFSRSNETGNNLQDSDTLPPPGLRRMVLGQMEHQEIALGGQDNIGDEPPPGLSRMVLGQTESGSLDVNQIREVETNEPPVGLHRMIPGESSSPESTIRQQSYTHEQRRLEDDYVSETELNHINSNSVPQQRSATIGADTPPSMNSAAIPASQITIVNRSETIGADTSPSAVDIGRNTSSENRIGAIGLNSIRETNLDGGNTVDETVTNNSGVNRRDSVEGQPQEVEVGNLVSTMRDLTVGENPTDGATSVSSIPEMKIRRSSRQESSDSEHDPNAKSSRNHKDRRHRDKDDRHDRDKTRDHYSPDSYRDKKYERRKYRDGRFEDDTDYYSDKDRGWKNKEDRIRREVYERKYNSLHRDKERRKRDYRDYGKDNRRGDYYYSKYEDEYDNEPRSRPSSRSDSMHEAYRERGHERDHRDHHRQRERQGRHRDPYNSSYMQGFAYDPYNPYYQYQYQYYENLRRTNPQAYAEMYRKYYQQAASGQSGTFGTEDRASVHSGRSSANDELTKDRYTRQSYYSQTSLPHMGGYYRDSHTHSISGQYGLDDSSYNRPYDHTDSSLNFEDGNVASNVTAHRLTPAKFSTAHVKASIESGHLIKVLPNYPLDGQPATVEIANIQTLLVNDDVYKELIHFPGPLIKGVTHKKTIIEYCESKIRNAVYDSNILDTESYILIWELLILLIRQNGMVVGTDIAELLMKDRNENINRPASVASTASSVTAEIAADVSEAINSVNSESFLKEEVVTNKFREYLIYGSGKEALEWAMKHGLWGHALFLASKLDKRTYANVMMRFANGLTMNDPLQTLYQLLSGRLPAAVTCVADEKWGDWRPHLAMILSNTTQRPELDRKAITTLADTLFNRGNLYAAQFCYLMADVGFSRYESPTAKLVLLGSNHNKPFQQFATNEAIHMTEVYEYACSLNDNAFVITEFQQYKYMLATRLADRGLLEKALLYLEKTTSAILQNPKAYQPSLINDLCTLADRLKYYDQIEDPDDAVYAEGSSDTSRPGNTWLKNLRVVQNDFNMGVITHESFANIPPVTPELEQQKQTQVYDQLTTNQEESWQQQYQQTDTLQQQWQPQQVDTSQMMYQPLQQTDQFQEASYSVDGQQYAGTVLPQQQQWPNQQQQWMISKETSEEHHNEQQNDYWNNTQTEPADLNKEQAEDAGRPQISMPNQIKGHSLYEDYHQDKSRETEKATNKDSPVKGKPQLQPKQDKTASTGWFGGIWSKLALRPKNQMKLPDDKNPTIVWDSEKKRWINLEEEGSESANEIKPPPKMSEMFPTMQQPNLTTIPGTNQEQQNPNYQNDSVLPNHHGHFDIGSTKQPVMNYGTVAPTAAVGGIVNVPSPAQTDEHKQPQSNMFKMQRNRNLKKSYVDVFNPGGKITTSGQSSFPPPNVFGSMPITGSQMNFFVPQPTTDPNAPTDFLTPATAHIDDNAQMSRWSSASSLSREVQYYMRQKPPAPR